MYTHIYAPRSLILLYFHCYSTSLTWLDRILFSLSMDRPSLPRLPAELVQRIYVALDSRSALSLSQTCHRIRDAGSDWTVIRDILHANNNPDYPSSLVLASNPPQDVWKRYVLADVRARRCHPITRNDIEQWLPHILALNRK
jgi:hypothetical protein